MPSVSQQQQKLFGLALSVKRGETPESEASDAVMNIVNTMSEKDIEKYAKTSHSGLPKKAKAESLSELRKMIREEIQRLIEADSPTERTRRYNRKNKEKVRKYLKATQEDRVARNRDRAKAVERNGEAKMKNKDVHHPNGPHGGTWRSVKKDHGPDKK